MGQRREVVGGGHWIDRIGALALHMQSVVGAAERSLLHSWFTLDGPPPQLAFCNAVDLPWTNRCASAQHG